MNGNTEIIEGLNSLLCLELTAMDQYFIHSEMYADWGLYKLRERIAHESEDERSRQGDHRENFVPRGKPRPRPLQIGETVSHMLQCDLNISMRLAPEVIALCESHSDFVTRDILQQNLRIPR